MQLKHTDRNKHPQKDRNDRYLKKRIIEKVLDDKSKRYDKKRKRRSFFFVLNRVLVRTKAYYILAIFIISVFLVAGIIFLVEPGIPSYGDAVWYCFVDLFTIGFGDYVAQTGVGKFFSIFLTAYSTVIIAVITGVIVSFYTTLCDEKYKDSKEELIDQLEHLDSLSKEELRDLSKRVKRIQ